MLKSKVNPAAHLNEGEIQGMRGTGVFVGVEDADIARSRAVLIAKQLAWFDETAVRYGLPAPTPDHEGQVTHYMIHAATGEIFGPT